MATNNYPFLMFQLLPTRQHYYDLSNTGSHTHHKPTTTTTLVAIRTTNAYKKLGMIKWIR